MERIRRHMLAAVALLTGTVLAGVTPVADGDVYWHLAAAREMLRTHAVLTSDPFSTGAAGRPWIDVHWLFQLAIYAVHRAGGLQALVIAKCLALAVGALLLLAAVERRARPVFVPLFVGALFCARHLLLVRPVIVSLVFLAFFFFVLERVRRGGRASLLWTLPIAQVVWCNSQGLAAFGPAMVGAYALTIGSPVLMALAGCLLAFFATPYGIQAIALPLELLARVVPGQSNPFVEIAENVPPFVLERMEPGQLGHLPWFLALLALGLVSASQRLRLSHVLLVAGFVALALMANRNVLLLYWIATPIVAMQLAPALRRGALAFSQTHARALGRWTYRASLLAVLTLATLAATREPSIAQPSPFHMPTEATQVLARASEGGSIFAADHYGGYLIWKLFPRFKPYIDTRLVLRTPEELTEYLGVAENPERFDSFEQRHGFSYVLLPIAYPDRYLDLVAHLYGSREWKVIFADAGTVLFARRADRSSGAEWDLGAPEVNARILADIATRFAGEPRLIEAARLQLATLLIAVREPAQAEALLSELLSPAALALRARSRLTAGDLDGAQQLAAQLLQGAQDDSQNLALMAAVHMRRGQQQQAVSLLRHALTLDPFDREATRLLAAVEEHQYANAH